MLAALLTAVTAQQRVRAACDCTGGDGRFTTHQNIVIDGSFADWTAVLADPDNNTCDGAYYGGKTYDPNATIEPWPDLDAYGGYANYNPADESQNFNRLQSTGRDLTHFAWTWDDDYIYAYTERLENSNNINKFIYYADIDNNERMESGEPVIVVLWQGSNRTVSVYIGTYDGINDPMVDNDGYADGYSLPGDLNVPTGSDYTYQGTFGGSNGVRMEWRVAWADLGLTGPTAINFHVASTNSQPNSSGIGSQIDDNLAGCGGTLGTTQFAALEFTPDRALTGKRDDTVVAAHTITNDGNAPDVYDLAFTTAGDFTPNNVNLYFDNDGSGTLNAGDTAMSDTNGDGNPDTDTLNEDETVNLIFTYTIPNTVNDGDTATVTLTATSAFDNIISDQVVDTVTAVLFPDILVVKQSTVISDPVNAGTNPLAIPGAVIEYSITVTNQGGGSPDADTVVVTDPIPDNTSLMITDLGGTPPGPVAFADGTPASGLTVLPDNIEYSNTGSPPYTYGYTPTASSEGTDPAVTALQITPTGTMNADTGSGHPSFTIRFRTKMK